MGGSLEQASTFPRGREVGSGRCAPAAHRQQPRSSGDPLQLFSAGGWLALATAVRADPPVQAPKAPCSNWASGASRSFPRQGGATHPSGASG
ncbi:MAG: hypothetical protein RJA70_1902 [Pseudomonadota bacterium]|jgi:hypothetical protein